MQTFRIKFLFAFLFCMGTAVATSKAPRVTLWIHGTKALCLLGDYIHATPRPGLIPLHQLSSWYRLKGLLQTLHTADAQQFPLEHAYAYGWSGTLSFRARLKEAEALSTTLQTIHEQYKAHYGIAPIITCITHSHGGNLLLNTVRYTKKDTFKIRAILLGCPVQEETASLINNPFFEQVYVLYSHGDWLQVLDPQGTQWSGRLFPCGPRVKQAAVRINGSSIGHLGFIRHRFVQRIPTMLKMIEADNGILGNNFYSLFLTA